MSELLHPGRHPDADQLSAFAEHVLPDHERLETLAHLAECPDCREIVFITQRTQETQDPLAHAFPGRARWLRSLRNLWPHSLWPVAAALTCGLLVAAFVQHGHHVDRLQKSDLAFESKLSILPSQGRSAEPIVAGALLSGRPPAPKSSVTSKGASSPHPAPATAPSGTAGFSPVHGNRFLEPQLTNNLSAFSFSGSAAGKQSADASSAGPNSMGSATGGPVAQARRLQEQKNSPPIDRREQTADLQSQSQMLSQQVSVPRSFSEPSQIDAQPSANQTVEVMSAPPVLQAEGAVVSASVFNLGGSTQAKSARAPLPSKRFAASTTSNGLETLAVDSAGDLFLSKDAGISWQRVARQWTGKAVKVSLASPSVTRAAPNRTSSSGATPSPNFETVTPAAVRTGVGFELTTDTGAIWSSSDGLVWKRE